MFFLFLSAFALLPCFALEEQQYQARIYAGNRKEPAWIFPLTPVSYGDVEKGFLKVTEPSDYIIYSEGDDQIQDTRDLCGYRIPETAVTEGDRP